MNSNYVAEIESTCIPDEQLVSVDIYVSGYKLLVRDTCCRATCVLVSTRHMTVWSSSTVRSQVRLGRAKHTGAASSLGDCSEGPHNTAKGWLVHAMSSHLILMREITGAVQSLVFYIFISTTVTWATYPHRTVRHCKVKSRSSDWKRNTRCYTAWDRKTDALSIKTRRECYIDDDE